VMILEMGRVCPMTPVDITRVSFFGGDGDGMGGEGRQSP